MSSYVLVILASEITIIPVTLDYRGVYTDKLI
jgi:hypothetical protein